MLKTVRATLARRGYDLEFSFQNCMTSAFGFCLGDEKNFSTSPLASPGVRNCSLKYEPNSRALFDSDSEPGEVSVSGVPRGGFSRSVSSTRRSRISPSLLHTDSSRITHSVLKRGSNTDAKSICLSV